MQHFFKFAHGVADANPNGEREQCNALPDLYDKLKNVDRDFKDLPQKVAALLGVLKEQAEALNLSLAWGNIVEPWVKSWQYAF